MVALRVFRSWSLSARVTVMMAVTMVLLAIITYSVSNILLYRQAEASAMERQETNMRVAWDVLHGYGRAFRVEDGRLMAGRTALNDLDTPVDHIKALVGGTATIFLGDRRIATNVLKPDGSRAVGTQLTSDAVRQTVLEQGRPYRGTAEILGRTYFTAYDPITGADGHVIGILYTGIPADSFLAPVHQVGIASALISALVTLVAGVLCRRSARKMFQPMTEICGTIAAMAKGDYAVAIAHADATDEIGAIARGLVVFREGAREKQRADADQARAMEIVATQLAHLAEGDLTARIGDSLPVAYARLGRDFDAAAEGLGGAIGAISTSSGGIHQTAVEIRTAAANLSQRTERQAASLEETAASMRQLTGSAQKAAAVAGQANESMVSVRSELAQSDSVILEAVGAMTEIEKSSGEIAAIVAMIDGIAFQTNLLALNAGVEAARAGEAGNGFAVVASEVRSLAQRSADAARDVKQLIERSAGQVGAGVRIVERISETLRHASQHIGGFGTLMTEIAASAAQQSESVAQINSAISDMDQMTQQNAAMVEEATAATRGLTEGAEHLTQEVARFRIADRIATPVHQLRRRA